MTKSNAREKIAEVLEGYCEECDLLGASFAIEDALPSILEGMVKPLEFVKLSENCHRAMINKKLNIRVEAYGSGKWCVLWSVPGYCDTYVDGDFQTAKDGIDAANEERFSEFISAIGVET